jgi:hypothetical protein
MLTDDPRDKGQMGSSDLTAPFQRIPKKSGG